MKEYKGIERRRYIRLTSVFPVEFKVISPDGKKILYDFLQGFTADVSKGGILLRVNNLNPELSNILQKREAKLLLNIDVPLIGKPVEAVSNVAWMTVIKEVQRDSCIIGLSFEKISTKDRRRLMGYAMSLSRVPKLTVVALFFMLIALGLDRIDQIDLRRENALLVEGLTNALQIKGAIIEWLDKADKEKSSLLIELERQRKNIAKIEKERDELLKEDERLKADVKDLEVLKEKLTKSQRARVDLESQLASLVGDREDLQNQLDRIRDREKEQLQEFERIEKTHLRLEKVTLDNMYNWLEVHQNRKTGLVVSYEGDRLLKDVAFVYDQSLAAQAFLLYGDTKKAKDIFNFFNYKAQRHKGGFTNSYEVNTGNIVEYSVHCGPNIWLGIALMHYMDKTGDTQYLDLAKEIADWVIKIQDEDPDGGIRGGPDTNWFSTEHNLDGYAFFTMLAQKTKGNKYQEASQRTLKWIKDNAFTSKGGRVHRGKGDATIATDTFSWSIASLGPQTLIEIGMDPDAIMKFAEDNCKVSVDFVRPDGKVVGVTGFDFAKYKHTSRGGVVSSEWTAQMIVSLKMMSDFYLKMGNLDKAKSYRDKSLFYTNELEKLIIASPSPTGQGAGCLPYATLDNVDTGHGWRTPRGRQTGSISGTAYGIFAIKGYNPLKLASSE